VAKVQSRRGASSSVTVENIAPPEWWHWTRVVQAFSEVLQSRAASASRNGSRARSPRSVTSNRSQSRPSTGQAHTIRSFATACTLAEIADRVETVQKQLKVKKEEGYSTSSGSDEEGDDLPKVRPISPEASSTKSGKTASTKSGKHGHSHARRFSAAVPIVESDGSPNEGSMHAIDANISESADKIAEKVNQIQQKVRNNSKFSKC